MSSLAAAIKTRAAELGFQKVGICPADAPEQLAHLNEWLDHGCHSTMSWMSRTRQKRLNIAKVLPGVRSVVVVGLNYFTAADIAEDYPLRVARYAWGRDYHSVMLDRLRELAASIHQYLPGTTIRAYSDTGPISEKVWAQQAGVGWQGKHSILITPDYSSWICLGVLLLDAELEYDHPSINRCGSCLRCIEACPTQAITQPYVVDARRCIASLNIELRAAIPTQLRSRMGNWIFGCDICQEVCPWNRFAQATCDEAFMLRKDLLAMDAGRWLKLNEEGFLQLFKETSIARATWAGFLRNLVVALGNSGDPRYGGLLAQAMAHPEAMVRGHAAWAMAQLRFAPSPAALQARLAIETDSWVRKELLSALNHLDAPELCGNSEESN